MPGTYTYPGIYVEEVPSGVRTIIGVSTAETAFIDFFSRGPVDQAVRITSFGDFERQFGGLDTRSEASYGIQQYFLNGGQVAWVIRVPVGDPEPADLELEGGSPLQATLAVVASSPGTWGDRLEVAVIEGGSAGQFDLFVREVLRSDGRVQVLGAETHRNLTMRKGDRSYAVDVVNGASTLVQLTDVGMGDLPVAAPANASGGADDEDFQALSGGTDGSAFDDAGALSDASGMREALLGDETAKTGMFALDRIEPFIFNLLCLPAAASLDGTNAAAVFSAAETYCAGKRAFLIVDIPPTSVTTAPAMITWMGDNDGLRHQNAAVYFPRLTIPDTLNDGRLRNVGASGTLAGVYARTDANRGVWKAPAGTDAALRNARLAVTLSDPENGSLNPLGLDAPLFNLPRTETALTQLAAETNVPGPLRRRALHDELDARREGRVDQSESFFAPSPVFEVFLRGADEPVPLDRVAICDLSDPPTPLPAGWRRPPAGADVGVDPVLGRLALPGGATGVAVEVSYAYGYPGDLGGGPYDRRQSLAAALPGDRRPDLQLGVTRTAPGGNSDLRGNLAAAIDAWNDDPVTLGVIALMDSRSYGPPLDPTALPEIVVPAGCRLVIVAADWPEDPPDDLGRRTRTAGRLTPSGRRPHLSGPIRVRGTAPAGHLDPGELVLDGLLVEGGLLVAPGNLGGVRVAHTTLVPKAGADSVTVASGPRPEERNDSLRLVLERCISGPLTVARDVVAVSVTDSILDAADGHRGHGVAVTAPATDIQASTVLGGVEARTLDAGNSIFTERVTVERRQSGCVRFCYLPLASTAPRRFRCQPASQEAAGRVVPRFASVGYGQPVYGQLSPSCPDEIARGAEDEGEMGAFHFLQQPRRIDNLRASLDEYLRFGLEAGIFLVT